MAQLLLSYPSSPGVLLRSLVNLLLKASPATTARQSLLHILWFPGPEPLSTPLARLQEALAGPLNFASQPFANASNFMRDSQRSPLDCLVRQIMTSNALHSGLSKADTEMLAEVWGSLSHVSQELRQEKDFDERAVQSIRLCLKALQETHQLLLQPDSLAEERLQRAILQWSEGIETLEKLLEKGLALLPSLCPSLNWLWRISNQTEFWPSWAEWLEELRDQIAWTVLPHLGASESEVAILSDIRQGFRSLQKTLCSHKHPRALQLDIERLADGFDQALDFLDIRRERPTLSNPLADLCQASRDQAIGRFRLHKRTLTTLFYRAQEALLEVETQVAHDMLDDLEEVVAEPSPEGMERLEAWLNRLRDYMGDNESSKVDEKA